jgi:hypothetical protein
MTTKPVKPTVPPAPSRANPGSDFATKADAFAAFFSPFATYLDAVGTFTDGRADAALAAALAGDLPALTGQAGNYLRLNGAGTALEWRTPAQVATQTRGLLDDRIINGSFAIWQRGTSTTSNDYGAADRWLNARAGGTVTQSRQSFPVGTQLGQNTPDFYLRQAVTGQSAAADRAHTVQRIEGVGSYSNGRVTVLGWARRSGGSGDFTVSCRQNFGTGGSPSTTVNLPCGVVLPLTSEWEPFAVGIDLPSIAGKTLGTNGNDSLELELWTSAGADHPRGAVIGVQTIEVDFWGIHVLPGMHTADAALHYRQRTEAEELAACERYYETGSVAWSGNVTSGQGYFVRQNMRTTKRATPTFTRTSTFASSFPTTGTMTGTTQYAQDERVANATGAGGFATTYTADAEL